MSGDVPALPWGISSQKIQPGSMKTITDDKLANFAVGNQKKSRFQKAREEKELKKKQEEEEAAKVFDSFVASFTEDEDRKTFIRGGKVQDSGDVVGGKRGEVYTMDRTKSQKPLSEMERMVEEMKSREERSSRSAQPRVGNFSDKPIDLHTRKEGRQIDDFLNEIKNKQASKPFEGDLPTGNTSNIIGPDNQTMEQRGSFDNGDPNTTNIYIGNLAPTVTEEHIHELFGRYGDINSVKVMWPRTEEERIRKRNCGFVSFMRRPDAEDAKLELQDYNLEGYKMILGWGKAVKINSCPFVLPPPKNPIASAPPPPPPPPLPPAAVPGHGTAGLVRGAALGGSLFTSPPPPPLTTAQDWAGYGRPTVGPGGGGGPEDDDVDGVPIDGPATSGLLLSTQGSSTAHTTAAPPHPCTGSPHAVSSFHSGPSSSPMPLLSLSSSAALMNPLAAATATAAAILSSKASKWDAAPVLVTEVEMKADDPQIEIRTPSDPTRLALINLMAKFVAGDGEAFEKTIKVREESNPDYAFLFQSESEEGQYYRWRTYANIMTDTERKWRRRPFQLAVDGPFLIPPERERSPTPDKGRGRAERRKRSRSTSRSISRSRSNDRQRRRRSRSTSRDRDRDRGGDRGRDRYDRDRDRGRRSRSRSVDRGTAGPARGSDRDRDRDRGAESDRKRFAGMTGAQIERAKAKERGQASSNYLPLTDEQYDDFETMLQGLSISREPIKVAMGFAYDNVEAADEVVNMLKEALLVRGTPPSVKVARLYLLSDILHNSGAPIKHASNYRSLLSACLPEIFLELGALRRSILGRMTSRQVEDRVRAILTVWEDWSILTSMYLAGLEAGFYESEAEIAQVKELEQQHKTKERQQEQEEYEQYQPSPVPGASSTASNAELRKAYEELKAKKQKEKEREIESLHRSAKLSGVFIRPSDSSHFIRLKLEQSQKYLKMKTLGILPGSAAAEQFLGTAVGGSAGGGAGASGARLSHSNEEEDEDDDIDGVDLDGVPIDGLPYPPVYGKAALFSGTSKGVHGGGGGGGFGVWDENRANNGDGDNDDDDIDGAPMDFIQHITKSAHAYAAAQGLHRHTSASGRGEDDDDIDGVPLGFQSSSYASTAGVSIVGDGTYDDDDDVDGVPLDAATPVPPARHSQATSSSSSSSKKRRAYAASSSDDDDDSDDGPGRIDLESMGQPTGTVGGGGSVGSKSSQKEEKRRRRLRRLEATLLTLRDEMEAKGKSSSEIEVAVSEKRAEKMAEWD